MGTSPKIRLCWQWKRKETIKQSCAGPARKSSYKQWFVARFICKQSNVSSSLEVEAEGRWDLQSKTPFGQPEMGNARSSLTPFRAVLLPHFSQLLFQLTCSYPIVIFEMKVHSDQAVTACLFNHELLDQMLFCCNIITRYQLYTGPIFWLQRWILPCQKDIDTLGDSYKRKERSCIN